MKFGEQSRLEHTSSRLNDRERDGDSDYRVRGPSRSADFLDGRRVNRMGILTHDDLDDTAASSIGRLPHARAGRFALHGKRFAHGERGTRLRGLTYGPVAPDAEGQPFPPRNRVRDDLAMMQTLGANSIRTYHVPPPWLLDLVDRMA